MKHDSEPVETLGLLFRDMGRVPLLSAEQEVALARRLRGLDVPVPPPGDPRPSPAEAERRLVEQNLRLVVSVARRFRGREVALEDLIQEGVIGLKRAVQRFDPERGFRLSTYATWWIRQAVSRAIANDTHTVRLPGHAASRLAAVRREAARLELALGRPPGFDEIGARLGLSPQEVGTLLVGGAEVVSLDSLVDGEPETALIDRLPDDAKGPDEVANAAALREAVGRALGALKPRERVVVELRYGIGRAHPETLQEVSEELGVTRERVRQIELHALRRLRHSRMFRSLVSADAAEITSAETA